MLFSITLNIALAVCILGTIYRVVRWFTVKVGPDAGQFTARTRFSRAFAGLFSVLFSRNIFRLIGVFFFRVVFQGHILKKDPWRWLMHFNIFAGILLLTIFHALDDQISASLFADYAASVNPFLFLRNLFAAMVLLGIMIAGYRRLSLKGLKKISTSHDVLALVLLSIILFSGFFLEASQFVSEPIFNEMVEDYGDPEDTESLTALQSYWAKYHGVVFADAADLSDPDLIEAGKAVHLGSCIDCHARPTAAFVSNPISKIIIPAGVWANSIRLDLILWQVHFLCCFAMLAYLPFSKFMHLFTSSVSLMVRSLEDNEVLQPANRITRRVISLDACMNCGQCSLHCSVEPINRVLGNLDILPSHKLGSLKKFVRKGPTTDGELSDFNEGSFICTECYRCTEVCPAGINLQDLWLASKDDLTLRGPSRPYRQVREGEAFGQPELTPEKEAVVDFKPCLMNYSDNPASFSACIQCGTCTNVCPVVADYQQDPELLGYLDLTPQQIVNTYRLGITRRAVDSTMAWDCFMCFQCQEHCPKEIPVAEMMYELRNKGYKGLREPLNVSGEIKSGYRMTKIE
ncbi:CoB--CoM heterodisulfide reductase subunit C (EC [Olavius sp. associated proteobacterium Delta 1]|nr:CoB--CoM heterodisulfide reductase subunit C (EC [Olavius sp. associated proteobacterium Delta 1]